MYVIKIRIEVDQKRPSVHYRVSEDKPECRSRALTDKETWYYSIHKEVSDLNEAMSLPGIVWDDGDSPIGKNKRKKREK